MDFKAFGCFFFSSGITNRQLFQYSYSAAAHQYAELGSRYNVITDKYELVKKNQYS